MSIGPATKAQKETSITSMKVVASGMLHGLRKDPAPTLFYCGIAFLLVGLPLNVTFPPAYYGIMLILGLILIGHWYGDLKAEKKKSHAK